MQYELPDGTQLSLPSEAVRLELLRIILERHLSVRHTEDAARRMQAAPANGSPSTHSSLSVRKSSSGLIRTILV